jgi:hypothetical protein
MNDKPYLKVTLKYTLLIGLFTLLALAARPPVLSAPVPSTTTIVPVTLPAEVPVPETTTTTTTLPPTTTTTTTTIPIPEDGKCVEWWQEAYRAGWPIEDLPKLGKIMWAESRCLPDVVGTGAYGLTQIQWSAHSHWVKAEFGFTKEDLFVPYNNFLAARWLYEYADNSYGCGWQPWYMSGSWC